MKPQVLVVDDEPDVRSLVRVLLDQLAHLPEVGFSLPLPRHPRLLGLCNELIECPGQLITLPDWAERLGLGQLWKECKE